MKSERSSSRAALRNGAGINGGQGHAGEVAESIQTVRRIAMIMIFTLGFVMLLAASAVVLKYGKEALPDLRPCARTTMGCRADSEARACEVGWWGSRQTSCADR